MPIYAERGPHGGIRLVDGYRTRLTGMTADEAEGLFLAGLPGPAAQLGLGTVVAAAQLKVMAALPTELRSRATRMVERFHLDVSGWFHADETGPHLTTVSTAVWAAARSRSCSPRPGARRTHVGPLGLVLKAGVWYVVAAVDDQIRTYRASRVIEVTPLATRVERPADFDLAEYWTESSSAYERESRTPRSSSASAPTASSGCGRSWASVRSRKRRSVSRSRIRKAGSTSGCGCRGRTRSRPFCWVSAPGWRSSTHSTSATAWWRPRSEWSSATEPGAGGGGATRRSSATVVGGQSG